MSKSYHQKDYYEDYGYDDGYYPKGSKKKANNVDDKRKAIQQARKKAQAERDKASRQMHGPRR